MQQRRSNRNRLILLAVGLGVLGLLTFLLLRGQNSDDGIPVADTSAPTTTLTLIRNTPRSAETPITPEAGFTSPADQWASKFFSQYQDRLINRQPSSMSGGLIWWESDEQKQLLMFDGEDLFLGAAEFSIDDKDRVEVFLPEDNTSASLISVGVIQKNEGTVSLSLSSPAIGEANSQWLVSGVNPTIALSSLAYQGQELGFKIEVAYEEEADNTARLIIIRLVDEAALTPTPVTPTPTINAVPSITLIPSRTPMPTATRRVDDYYGRIISESVAITLSNEWNLEPTTMASFINGHPWVGKLTWTEEGPMINNRETAIEFAEEFSIYILSEGDNPQLKALALTYETSSDTTRIPELQVYFQGHRMEECLFWLYRISAENGGQFTVAYDDYGASQAITIVDFVEFN